MCVTRSQAPSAQPTNPKPPPKAKKPGLKKPLVSQSMNMAVPPALPDWGPPPGIGGAMFSPPTLNEDNNPFFAEPLPSANIPPFVSLPPPFVPPSPPFVPPARPPPSRIDTTGVPSSHTSLTVPHLDLRKPPSKRKLSTPACSTSSGSAPAGSTSGLSASTGTSKHIMIPHTATALQPHLYGYLDYHQPSSSTSASLSHSSTAHSVSDRSFPSRPPSCPPSRPPSSSGQALHSLSNSLDPSLSQPPSRPPSSSGKAPHSQSNPSPAQRQDHMLSDNHFPSLAPSDPELGREEALTVHSLDKVPTTPSGPSPRPPNFTANPTLGSATPSTCLILTHAQLTYKTHILVEHTFPEQSSLRHIFACEAWESVHDKYGPNDGTSVAFSKDIERLVHALAVMIASGILILRKEPPFGHLILVQAIDMLAFQGHPPIASVALDLFKPIPLPLITLDHYVPGADCNKRMKFAADNYHPIYQKYINALMTFKDCHPDLCATVQCRFWDEGRVAAKIPGEESDTITFSDGLSEAALAAEIAQLS
ncbi:hypothetical protein K439DRAFT_1613733 [Ramaria rubella]|nr:hypothetical protein K439DRAFT_1613733 [Ramaria rubella]